MPSRGVRSVACLLSALLNFPLMCGLVMALPRDASSAPIKSFTVNAGTLQITVSPEGQITSIATRNKWKKTVLGTTRVEGCTTVGPVSARSIRGGGAEFTRTFADSEGTHRCTVIDRFLPDGHAIRWEIVVEGTGTPWSSGISTCMEFRDTTDARFWTTWGSPNHISPANWGNETPGWHNPFETRPFRDMHLVYGGHFGKGAGYSIPVFSVIDSTDGSGIALAMSPEDPLLDVHMITTHSGGVTQTRRFNRIEKGRLVRFTLHLYAHEPDWRAVVAFVVDKYPRFFHPKLASAMNLCGLGAYSSYEGEIDTARYNAIGGIVNWKASFDFSYMGMFIPPVPTDTTRWQRFDVTSEGEPIPGRKTYSSIEHLREYAAGMKKLGFSTLNYFNVSEFGGSSAFSPAVVYPRPHFTPEQDVWQNPSAFLYDRFPGAILFGALDHVGWHKRTPQQHMDSPVRFHEEPFWTWGGAIATDVGDSAYAAFLLEQARLHIQKLPDAQGLCIDRFDWFNEYNWHADDGVSWAGGRPVRSLLVSYKRFIPLLGTLMHSNGKAIFCNPHMNRMELMEQIDGVYNEFGQIGHNLNLSAFLCLYKPLLCWTPDKQTVLAAPDAYFQHHLLMGAFPTAPFPGNDHTIQPDPEVEQHYLAYGPMFRLLRRREWILLPNVISVQNNSALCNVFVKGKNQLMIPVMMGTTDSATVILRHCKRLLGRSTVSIEVWYPGENRPMHTSLEVHDDSLTLPVQLRRGCAFIVIAAI